MSRALVLLLVLTSVIACSKPEPPAPAQVPAGTAVTTTKAPSPGAPTEFRYSPFPQGVNPTLALHFRHDRINTRQDGERRRLVAFEYLTGDQRSAMDALSAAMSHAGYQAGRERTRTNGALEVIFRKEKEKIIGTILTSVGQKPSHPDAKGIVALNMPFNAVAETTVQAQ